MKCGQGKPFKSYQTGGLVTKGPEKVPQDIDMISSLKGKERADAEKRMGVTPPAKAASMPSGVGKPPQVSPRVPSGARYTGEVTKEGKGYQSFRDSTGREILVPTKK